MGLKARSEERCENTTALTLSIAAILLAVLVALPFGCGKKAVEEIKIGVVTPLTGDWASYGQQTQEGIDLSVKEINVAGGIDGKLLVALFEDDRSSTAGGVAALKKLIDTDKVPVVIGGFVSDVTLAIAPTAEKKKTVLVSASSTADKIMHAGDYIFRIVPTNAAQGEAIARFALEKLNANSAAMFYMNSEYGITLKDGITKHFSKGGGKIEIIESYNPKDRDFRTQLSKIKASGVDLVFFPGLYEESGLVLRQAREMGIDIHFLGGDGSIDEKLISLAGDAAEGTYYTNLALGVGVTDSLIGRFSDAFQIEYGHEPSTYSAYAYDVVYVIAEAIRIGSYSSEGIKNALYDIKGFTGVSGITSFDSLGEVDKPFYMYTVQNGRFEVVR